jgi:hypothetical protein
MGKVDFVVDQNGVVTDVRNKVWPVSSSIESAPWDAKPLVLMIPIPVGLILMILEMLIRSHVH